MLRIVARTRASKASTGPTTSAFDASTIQPSCTLLDVLLIEENICCPTPKKTKHKIVDLRCWVQDFLHLRYLQWATLPLQ